MRSQAVLFGAKTLALVPGHDIVVGRDLSELSRGSSNGGWTTAPGSSRYSRKPCLLFSMMAVSPGGFSASGTARWKSGRSTAPDRAYLHPIACKGRPQKGKLPGRSASQDL
jgi:hypothetical protein